MKKKFDVTHDNKADKTKRIFEVKQVVSCKDYDVDLCALCVMFLYILFCKKNVKFTYSKSYYFALSLRLVY